MEEILLRLKGQKTTWQIWKGRSFFEKGTQAPDGDSYIQRLGAVVMLSWSMGFRQFILLDFVRLFALG